MKKDQQKNSNEDIMMVLSAKKHTTTKAPAPPRAKPLANLKNPSDKDIDDSIFEMFETQVTDPRQSTRILKMTDAKNKIQEQTEQYQIEVKKMQDEIKAYKDEIKK